MTKARIIYTPEGGGKREWIVDPERPAWDVMYATEKATGWPWEEFSQRLAQSSGIAIQALIWALRKRDEPRLLLDSVRPTDPTASLMDEVEFDVVDEDPAPEAPESGEA